MPGGIAFHGGFVIAVARSASMAPAGFFAISCVAASSAAYKLFPARVAQRRSLAASVSSAESDHVLCVLVALQHSHPIYSRRDSTASTEATT
jgi:hypothetical protein